MSELMQASMDRTGREVSDQAIPFPVCPVLELSKGQRI